MAQAADLRGRQSSLRRNPICLPVLSVLGWPAEGFSLAFSGSFPFCGRGPFLFIFLWKILHDERNAPVGRIKRVLRVAQPTIGISAHLRNLIRRQSVLLHEAACRVGTIGREFPVPIIPAPNCRDWRRYAIPMGSYSEVLSVAELG
jgi:hypothetical protein